MGKKVMVVDNTMYSRIVLRDMLISHGYSVVEAMSEKDALEKYEAIRPDLVTVDVTTPEVDGAAAVAHLRDLDPHARVLMCGTRGQRQRVMDGMTRGAEGIILKPFSERQVIRTVRHAIG
jgi:two-component system, chemotaxis family, chemotaxis protein CheY